MTAGSRSIPPDHRDDLPGAEVEPAIERLDRVEDLGLRETGVVQDGHLDPVPVHQVARGPREPPLLLGLTVERRARVGRGERDLDRVRLDLARVADRLLDRRGRLPRKAEDEGPMDRDPERLRVPRELPGDVEAHALLDVVQDPLIPGLVADQQEAKAVVLQDLERPPRHVRLRVARPGHTQAAQAASDLLGPRKVVGERVIVEEELAHLGEVALGPGDLGLDARRASHPVPMAADRLRPQAEGALGSAAPPRVERDVGVQEIADEVVLDRQIPPVHVDHEGQGVHVLDGRPGRREPDPVPVAVGDALHVGEPPPLRDLGARVVELPHTHPVHGARGAERRRREHGHMGAYHAHQDPGVLVLQALRNPDVTPERGRARVHHHVVVLAGERRHLVHRQAVGRRVHQAATGHERGGLGEPGRVPERADLPTCLIAGARAAVEALERRRMEEQRPERHPSLRWARTRAAPPRWKPGARPERRPGERSSSARATRPSPA